MHSIEELKELLRDVPNFPIEGVMFKDITTLLTHPGALIDTVNYMQSAVSSIRYDAVAVIESRGFIFGSVIAALEDKPLILIRKPGKLPADTISEEYTLEYGSNTIEMHRNSVPKGSRILIVDDLIATGGSAQAAASLLGKDGCIVAGAVFVIDLPFLGGMEKLRKDGIIGFALIEVDSE